MPRIEWNTDNLSSYADDPDGYINVGHTSRSQREKQWIVAVHTNELESQVEVPSDFRPWIKQSFEFEEPRAKSYTVKKRILFFWASRTWQRLYLLQLGGVLFFLPLQISDTLNGGSTTTIHNFLPVALGLLLLGMFLTATLPAIGAIGLRLIMYPFLLSRGTEEPTHWNVFFVFGLRATSNSCMTWFRAAPSFAKCTHACIPTYCRFLPLCAETARVRVVINSKVTRPLFEAFLRLFCLPFSARVAPNPPVDFSPPKEFFAEQKIKQKLAAEKAALEAEEKAWRPALEARGQTVQSSEAKEDGVNKGTPPPSPEKGNMEEEHEVSGDNESAVSYDPTDTNSQVSQSTLTGAFESDQNRTSLLAVHDEPIGATNPFAHKSTKRILRQPTVLPNKERNRLPPQSQREPKPPSGEHQIVPLQMSDSVTWRCRACGRWNAESLIRKNDTTVRMKIDKQRVHGTQKMKYTVALTTEKKVPTCRICGTLFSYEPTGYNEKYFFNTEGDDKLSVYRKNNVAAKVGALPSYRATDPSKRSEKIRSQGLKDGTKQVTQYRSSRNEILAEVAASKLFGYRGFDVKTSRPPWMPFKKPQPHPGDEQSQDEEDGLMKILNQGKPTQQHTGQKETTGRRRSGVFAGFISEATKVSQQARAAKATMREAIGRRQGVQVIMNACRSARAAIRVARQMAASLQENEDVMIFNDYRFKEREAEFAVSFERHRSPDHEKDEFFPLHALVESIAHNPRWTPAIITRVHTNNSYDLRFEDGTDVQCVECNEIRFRLSSRVSILMQCFAFAFLLLVSLTPLMASVFFLFLFESYSITNSSTSAVPIVIPLFLVSLCSWLAQAIQLFCIYIQETKGASCFLHIKLWCFFSLPGFCVFLGTTLILDKLSDPENGEMWSICFAPLSLSIFFTTILATTMKRLYGTFVMVFGFFWFLFLIGLGAYLDFPLLFSDGMIFAIFSPLGVCYILLQYGSKYLPYIWEARWDIAPNVEPELAAYLSMKRREDLK